MHNVCVNDHRHQTTNIHLNQLQIYLILRHSPEKSENIHKKRQLILRKIDGKFKAMEGRADGVPQHTQLNLNKIENTFNWTFAS